MKRSEKRLLKDMMGQFKGGEFSRPQSLEDPIPDFPIGSYVVQLANVLPPMSVVAPGKSADAAFFLFDGTNLTDTGLKIDVYNYTFQKYFAGTFQFVSREPISGLYFAIGRATLGGDDVTGGILNCVYSGADVSATCQICKCVADPWILCLGDLNCPDGAISGCYALWYSSGSADECQWASDPDSNGFNFVLTLNADFSGQVELVHDGVTTKALWKADRICCDCTNCFNLQCPIVYPPCDSIPTRICIQPPKWTDAVLINHGNAECWNSVCTASQIPAAYQMIFAEQTFAIAAFGCLPKMILTPNIGSCNYTAGCTDETHSVFITLTIECPDVTMTIDLANPDHPLGVVITYKRPCVDWDCTGSNIMTIVGDSMGFGDEVTVEPVGGLTTPSGVPVLNPDGTPIMQPYTIPCDPSLHACSCVFTVESHVWHWNSGGDGNIIGCEQADCDSSQCPDPSSLPDGTTCSFHTLGH